MGPSGNVPYCLWPARWRKYAYRKQQSKVPGPPYGEGRTDNQVVTQNEIALVVATDLFGRPAQDPQRTPGLLHIDRFVSFVSSGKDFLPRVGDQVGRDLRERDDLILMGL